MSNMDKINRVRRILQEEAALIDPSSTQEERAEALQNRSANKRQVPTHTREYRDVRNGMTNLLPADRTAVEVEMVNQPSSAHGFPTAPGAYQEFSSHEVTTRPQAIMNTYNTTNFGFPSETGDRARKMAHAVRVQDILRQNLDRKSLDYVNSVTTALKRQIASGMVNPKQAFQRYEVQARDSYTTEQLHLIGMNLGLVTERYDSTGGLHVVTMPFSSPKTPEEVAYNLGGMDGVNGAEASKRQVGNYWMNTEDAEKAVREKQLPPARQDSEDKGLRYYRAGDQKSQRSLKNPQRGSDFIRHSRIENALKEERRQLEIIKNKVEELREPAARYSQLLESDDSWKRDEGLRELKRIKNQLEHLGWQERQLRESTRNYVKNTGAVTDYAAGVSRMLDTETREQVIAEQAHNRHLNLLEEAKNILSGSHQGGNLLT